MIKPKPIITITDKAAAKLNKKIITRFGDSTIAGIKFYVKAGGCHDLKYVIDIVNSSDENDGVYISNGIIVYIPSKCLDILKDVTIDVSDNLLDEEFKYDNPQAKSSCGCGSSFVLKESKEKPD